MMAAIANGGRGITPRIVQSIEEADGMVLQTFPSREGNQIMSPETAKTLQTALIATLQAVQGEKREPANIRAYGLPVLVLLQVPSGQLPFIFLTVVQAARSLLWFTRKSSTVFLSWRD